MRQIHGADLQEFMPLQEYASHGGWRGWHTETGVHAALFTLLMWEILFGPALTADAFTSRYQVIADDCG